MTIVADGSLQVFGSSPELINPASLRCLCSKVLFKRHELLWISPFRQQEEPWVRVLPDGGNNEMTVVAISNVNAARATKEVLRSSSAALFMWFGRFT